MNALLLTVTILFCSLQTVLKRVFTSRTGGKGTFLFSAITCLGALGFFLVTGGRLSFEAGIVPYAIAFAASYAISSIFGILAVATGSMCLSSLIISCSLIIPSLYGLIFLKEPGGIGLYAGIVLLLIALVLVNRKDTSEKAIPITPKWLLFVFLSFLGNGMCSVTQKMQQVAFDGAYKNEFMIIALCFVFLFTMLPALKAERKEFAPLIKSGWWLALLCGLFNGVVNLFVMILSGRVPASVMFPLISGGGIVLTYIVSKVVYKEQMSRRQFVGFILGLLSIIFLSL